MAQNHKPSARRSIPQPSPLVRRACSCGGAKGLGDECTGCRGRKRRRGITLQPQLRLGTPGDRFEREADRIAEQVTSSPVAGAVKVQPVAAGQGGDVHRQSQGPGSAPRGLPESVHSALGETGEPLEQETRTLFERRFGHDFSAVRIHTGARAAKAADAINAKAFTAGRHIVFGRGHFAPRNAKGQKLLAHELTHVLQQRRGVVQRACKTQAGEIEYTIRSGDTLSEIAEAHDTTTQALKDRNGLAGDSIRAGDILCIPAPKKAAPKKAAPKKAAPKKAAPKKATPKKTATKKRRPKTVKYEVQSKDTLGKIAGRYDTTVQAIQKLNKLKGTAIAVGQMLTVPVGPKAKVRLSSGGAATCAISVPKNVDTQRLAGVIFSEAVAKRKSNDERRAIAWSFVNAVQHTKKLCGNTICTSLKKRQRKFLCKKDKRDLGNTILKAIKIGSTAHGNRRWNMVMSSNKLKKKKTLCKLKPGEQGALIKAIQAAKTVKANKKKVNYLRFNQAKNKPPSVRMVKVKAIGAHTFYAFKKKDSEGRCFV